MSFAPIDAAVNAALFDSLRPETGNPLLHDEEARDIFWRIGLEGARRYMRGGRDSARFNPTEAALALACDFMEYANRDGIWLWLSYNAGRDAVAAIVDTLSLLGAEGMAGHMRRAIAALLGSPETWPFAGWGKFVKKREKWLRQASPFGDGPYLTTTVDVTATGLTRAQWAGFYFECVREFAGTGDCPGYRQWFDAHARVAPPAAGRGIFPRLASFLLRKKHPIPDAHGLLPATDMCLILDAEKGERYYCESLDFFYDAWDRGYYYWEVEFEARCHAFIKNRLDDIRPEFRRKQQS